MQKPNEFKLNFSRYKLLTQVMAARGAPSHLLEDGVLRSSDLETSRHERYQPITPDDQLEAYRKSAKEGSGNFIHVIGTRDDENTAIKCALGLMLGAFIRYSTNPESWPQPFYHSVYGGVNMRGGSFDQLRDNENYQSNIGSIGLLVLGNLASDSTREKTEKARDLITLYAKVPRVIVVSGEDPLHFAVDALNIRPTRVLFIGHPSKKSFIQI